MMESQPILKTCLLEFLYELRDVDFPLILGGGYGLYLKQTHLQGLSIFPTLISGDFWPSPRATEDLDIFLTTEIVVDRERMGTIRAALDSLGYRDIESAKYTQFAKVLPNEMNVKIDLLTGPQEHFADSDEVHVNDRRVRLRKSVQLHAHPTDEALALGADLMKIEIDGLLPSGDPYSSAVSIPSAFDLLLMKLFAFRDRCQDERKDLGRHHALDAYRVIAMMSEQEWQQTTDRITEFGGHPIMADARQIVQEFFEAPESLGSLRMREHPLWNGDNALDDFLSALRDLFAAG
jgi:hypothetical protein